MLEPEKNVGTQRKYHILRQKRMEKRKRFFNAFIILVICTAILWTLDYFKLIDAVSTPLRSFMEMGHNKDKGNNNVTFNFDGTSTYEFGIFKDWLIVCGKDGVRGVGKNGKEQWSFPVGLNVPLLSIADKYIVVADKGGSEIKLLDNYGIKKSITVEGSIVMVHPAGSGNITVITKQQGYKGAATVYNTSGQAVYRWMSGSAYIIDAQLSPNGKRLAVALMDTSKGKAIGSIMLLNVGVDNEPYAGATEEDNLFSAISWVDNSTLCVVGDKALIMLDTNAKKRWSYSYGKRALSAYNISTADAFTLAFGKNSGEELRECNLEIIDNWGKKRGEYISKDSIRNIDAHSDIIAVIKNREAVILDKNGKVKSTVPVNRDIRSAHLFADKNKMLVISGAMADIIDIR